MSELAITAAGLGKSYRLSHDAGARRHLGQLARMFQKATADEVFWALRDVSFEVKSGEVIGFVGLNGAGKSTLLKVLSRITEPTEGRAVIEGRTGTLLEVGTGFHPELTGRENIYLSGAILGMRRAEIDRKFDEIIAFAEIERFLDTPVKRYSSGMYVRLAFAVAAHLESEVLLVDEVLAVGDVAFQKKCLGKMSEVGRQGRTVLFVSHNMVAVQNLCQRVMWLREGRLAADGPTSDVVRRYLSAASSAQNERVWSDPRTGPGNDKVRLRRVSVKRAEGDPNDLISMSTPLVVEVEYQNLSPGAHIHVCLHVSNEQSLAFVSASNETDPITRDTGLPTGVFRSVCWIPGDLLNTGIHGLAVLFRQNGRKVILRCDDALAFEVLDMEDRSGLWMGGRVSGSVHPKLSWKTLYLGDEQQPLEGTERGGPHAGVSSPSGSIV
ncbi:MAG: polysaccharide ABC transporter ATP-binding protein [Vicinamibacterales bacterium]